MGLRRLASQLFALARERENESNYPQRRAAGLLAEFFRAEGTDKVDYREGYRSWSH
jgi:hypothetical protein